MLQSMTGYGKAEIALPDKKVTIEIKSLNGKNSDTNVKIPVLYRDKEFILRKILQDNLKRGKIDCYISYVLNEGYSSSSISLDIFKSYLHQLKKIKNELDLPDGDIIATIMRLPDVIRTEKTDVDEEEWASVEEGVVQAINDLQKFRIQEGNAMAADLSLRIENISKLLSSVEQFEKQRTERMRLRIIKSLEELQISEGYDNNRLEQEMIYYIEKIDISEEKSRLENHLGYFLESMEDSEETGKKLAFISQEMGREINTLGSKANDSEIQKIVVQMKDELEKIKEQTLNIL